MRLDRKLALRGGYSRKISTKMIRKKRVTVDKVLCTDPKQHFDENALVEIDSYPLPHKIDVYAFHKPAGMLSTTEDPQGHLHKRIKRLKSNK